MTDETSTFDRWKDARFDQGERLVAFEAWCAEQLAKRLVWPQEPEKAKKQVMQCRALILHAVADMARHGFLFKPKQIAALIVEKLDAIAERQKAGEVRDLYAYLKVVWSSYVTSEADQLRERSLQLGTHVTQVASIVDALPTIVAEDLQESVREKKRRAAARQKKACKPAAEPMLDLFSD